MNSTQHANSFHKLTHVVSLFMAMILFAVPLCAQQPKTTPPKPSTPKAGPRSAEPTFDTLLAADRYKLYGEIRNVGQLMTSGGAGEIVDPVESDVALEIFDRRRFNRISQFKSEYTRIEIEFSVE